MKLYAVTICINYADYLECVIANRGHFDRWMVITVPMDGATHELCAKHGIECMDSSTLEEDGSDFNAVNNKSRMLNEAMDALFWSSEKTDDETWMVVLDADVLLPRHFGERVRALPLEKGCLYGMSGRKVCEHWEQFEMLRACEPWDTMAERNSQAIGYFNLFCTDAWPDRYAIRSGESVWEHDDYLFTTSFAPEKRRILPFTAIHLGNYGKNWKGRVSGRFAMRDAETRQFGTADFADDADSAQGLSTEGTEVHGKFPCHSVSSVDVNESAKSAVRNAAVLGYFPGGRWREFARAAGKTYLVDLHEIHAPSVSAFVEADRAVLRRKVGEEIAGIDVELIACDDAAAMEQITDGSVDLLYIPGEVSPDLLRELIPHWMPKLRAGATVCGDVYGLPLWANATHSIALIFGPLDRVEGGRWWKKIDAAPAVEKSEDAERGLIFNSIGSEKLEAMLVCIYAARKHWAGPIHVRHHGKEDESMFIALERLGVAVETVAGEAVHPHQIALRACLGSRFQQCMVMGQKHLLTRPPTFQMVDTFGFGEALESNGPFLMEGVNGSRRFAPVQSEPAALLKGDDCEVIVCEGEPTGWSETAWEHWCVAEAEATTFLAKEVRLAADATVVTIVTPASAGDFQRSWLTWKFPRGTSVVVILMGVNAEELWLPETNDEVCIVSGNRTKRMQPLGVAAEKCMSEYVWGTAVPTTKPEETDAMERIWRSLRWPSETAEPIADQAYWIRAIIAAAKNCKTQRLLYLDPRMRPLPGAELFFREINQSTAYATAGWRFIRRGKRVLKTPKLGRPATLFDVAFLKRAATAFAAEKKERNFEVFLHAFATKERCAVQIQEVLPCGWTR